MVINILNINDPPAIDFSGISGDPALGDTVVLYHGTSKAFQLDLYIEDIDDNVFYWGVEQNILLDIFLQTLASGQTSNLYRRFIDSQTQIMDIGATSVFGWRS